MKITTPGGDTVWLIGDPHMGRSFQTGVAPDKRGLREARQLEKLKAELATPGIDFNVMVGDLFDHPHVGYKVVLEVAEAFLDAALANPGTTFIAMAGNHDLPRNIGMVGAFDAFEEIVFGRCSNLLVVREPYTDSGIAVFPWQWGVPALDQLADVPTDPFQVAIGHWDLQSYGGDDSHLCPAAELRAAGVEAIYSGHYHIEGVYQVNGIDVNCTGSLEPYSHGEDPEGTIYVTLTLQEATDGRDLTANCVRVVLEDGEEIPEGLDCMALTAIKAKVVADEGEQISLGKFEWKTVLDEALADLDPEVKAFIEERLST